MRDLVALLVILAAFVISAILSYLLNSWIPFVFVLFIPVFLIVVSGIFIFISNRTKTKVVFIDSSTLPLAMRENEEDDRIIH